MIPLTYFPPLNATLNGITALLLLAGYYFIKQKNIAAHRATMMAAVTVSAVFLACYLYYHFHHGVTRFTTPGLPRFIYFFILSTHTFLAVLVVPMVIAALYQAVKGRFEKHKRITRWLWPIWMYVSVTGVIVYVMLYQLYPHA